MLDTPGDEQISGQIVARKLSSSRIEFGWLPSGSADADRVEPDPRFFPANPTVDKWLSSGSVAVAGSAIGHIEARRLHDGRTEFVFAPADQTERVYPDVRYFPPDARVGRWLKSSTITITPGPDDSADSMEAPDEDELGTTTQPSPEPPTTPPTTATGYRAVSAGGAHTCGLRTSGAIECWGNNGNGQTNAPAGTFTAVSAGNSYTCGLRESGAIECWGSNGNGQANDRAGRFTAVSAGQAHTCAIRTSGAIECWGDDAHGQANNRAGRFTAVSAGGHHTCGLRESGAIECWGNNVIGQANDRAGSYTAVSASSLNTCAIRSSGAIECWGGFRSIPAGSYRAVSTGEYHICGLRENGAITCWGENSDGQADAPTGSYTAVSAGARHTCGLRTTGEIECWGSNSAGQTNVPSAADGDGSEPERLINEAVPTGTVNIEGEDGDERAGDAGDQPTPEPRVGTGTSTPTPEPRVGTGTSTGDGELARDASITMDSFPIVPTSAESTAYGYIVARLSEDGRVEFWWQLPSGERVLPRARYFPQDPGHDRWLRSTPVEVGGVAIGRINVRRSGDGGAEFAFTPTGGERIEPIKNYFPNDAQVDHWLRTSRIYVE